MALLNQAKVFPIQRKRCSFNLFTERVYKGDVELD